MLFNVSHEQDGVYQSVLVEATTERIAEAYFKALMPESRVLGVHEARSDEFKLGKPVLTVPDEFRLGFIREHQKAFLKKMSELEKQGLRSGGWDEKSDKTAIVRPGKFDHENRIVGYMDRDLNIEWETTVLSTRFMGNNPYSDVVLGSVFVEGHVVDFESHLERDEVCLRKFQLCGPMKQQVMELPLPEVVKDNMEEAVSAVKRVVNEFLKERGRLHGMSVDALVSNATQRSCAVQDKGLRGKDRGEELANS